MTYVDAFTVLAGTFGLEEFKKAFGTPLAQQTYAYGSGLDGDLANAYLWPERCVSINTSAAVGAYNLNDPIIVRGERRGGGYTESRVLLTAANGNETVETGTPFHKVTSVYVPAQLLNTGTLKIGAGSVEFDPYPVALEVGAAGAIKVVTAKGENRDLTLPANLIRDVSIRRVRRDNATFPITVYVAA